MESSIASGDDAPTDGQRRFIDGRPRVFYGGYWIRAYEVPADTLGAKKVLIESLTRRLFNHVEHGINVPGRRLDEARKAYASETDPARRRVKGAMLAGAIFNRAADIFTKLVEMQTLGVRVAPDNTLMRECGALLQEALALGKLVHHISGDEGIDELWGEPFKAFAYPIEEFYRSRYVKIAHTMEAIDRISTGLARTLEDVSMFEGIEVPIAEFAVCAKAKAETLRTESDIFDVWTSLVVAGEKLDAFRPCLSPHVTYSEQRCATDGLDLVRRGRELVGWLSRARVPMPKSTGEFLERCAAFRASFGSVDRLDRRSASLLVGGDEERPSDPL